MNKILILSYVLFFSFTSVLFSQFGKNKVQYKDFTWYYIQTDHFDIYFNQNGAELAEFTAKASEEALSSIQESFRYKINNRITIIVYNSQNDFQETNVTDSYLTEGIQGFTELFKNRVVIQFTGSYAQFDHLIHHELVHAVMNDMFYGGSLQNIISNNININLPLWFNEGMAEYQALGWDVDTDMFIRDAAINEYLPDIQYLNGYLAYRGGQAVFHYIAAKYGEQKIGELINKIKGVGNFEEGLKETLGISLKELNERWKKDIKKNYWPDIAIWKDPDEFAKRLTDHREDGGFYNTSPAISPQGDKIAFISNRDYYFDVFLMDAIEGKIIKKLVHGNTSPDFEELNILTPGLSWSPDGKRIALAAKSGGYDVIYLIDVESEDRILIEPKLDGIFSVEWSPEGNYLAFAGQNSKQSDIYIYDLQSDKLVNLTRDVFSDSDPAWSPDGNKIFFASDRKDFLSDKSLPDSFKIYNQDFTQTDIYSIDVNSLKISRITDLPFSNETSPVCSPEADEILFISDVNGINNIYKKKIVPSDDIMNPDEPDSTLVPITNSLNGLYQLSVTADGKKLTFSSLYQSAFDIFLLTNPFGIDLEIDKLQPTKYIASLNEMRNKPEETGLAEKEDSISRKENEVKRISGNYPDSSRSYGDTIRVDFGQYVFGEEEIIKEDTSASVKDVFNLTDNLDKKGDFKVNKYKITFSPDIIYANAGYSTLYGLLGTTVLSFSDVLGDHRIIGLTSLQIDLKNSDYGLAYYYLPERINYGVEFFHTARFVYLTRGLSSNLFRFRNFGGVISASYPLNKFYRFDGGLSWLNVSSENLDNPSEEAEKVSYLIPSVSFVHDNVLWGFTAPIDGTRYRFDVFGNPGIGQSKYSFYSVLGDYRTYFMFSADYSFALRFAGGFSDGNNPQRFFIGGTENWINRTFATVDVPLESASDFAFLTAGLPLRGFNYAEQIGTRYGLLNAELRFPLIKYLLTGALPILFSNVVGVAFLDMGTAWNDNEKLKLFGKNESGKLITNDLLIGTGFGARIYFLYFLLRFDVAWPYTINRFESPKFYISLGADF
ncbi:MAG: hypothetical protein Kow0098_00400 [Ignavibacteriaceae bacterium]